MSGWLQRSLTDIGAALRNGEVTALALLDEARSAHAQHGLGLDAYRTWDDGQALARATAADAAFKDGRDFGPLQGIPFSAKDLFGIEDMETFAGSPNALPEKWSKEGPFIRAVLKQGAVLTGKTHMVEFAFGGLGTNAHWPAPKNPWDGKDRRVSGGSSSGAGVSIMEGSAAFALGTDTAGSVRVPASMTGTVGLKVTAGRWPLDGIVPLSPTLDTPGILTRSVADAALLFEAIDAHCSNRKTRPVVEAADISNVRMGLAPDHFWHDCPDDIAAVTRQALSVLENAEASMTPFELPETKAAYELFRQGSVVSSELKAFLKEELPDWEKTLDPNISFRMSGAIDIKSDEVADRRKRMAEITASANTRLEEIDVLVSPTVPITAPKVADVKDGKDYSAANLMALKNTCIANLLGLCAITMPIGLDNTGIPVGLQLMARANEEEKLLSVALAFEDELGFGWQRLGPSPLGA